MYNELNIDRINQCLIKYNICFEAKYFYLSFLEKQKIFLPFKANKKNLALQFCNNCDKSSLKRVQRVLQKLESSNLIKRTYGTANNGKRNIGNSLFLQLIPPLPYRFIQAEIIELATRNYKGQPICSIWVGNLNDLHDEYYYTKLHSILIEQKKTQEDKAFTDIQKGDHLYFIAEEYQTNSGVILLNNEFHFFNEWLMREYLKAQESLNIVEELWKEEEEELEENPLLDSKKKTGTIYRNYREPMFGLGAIAI
ncbi:hypothetical protein Trichorick_01412 (plasmid) [Candidatus Trichorickettsia mobilis]|uniref:Uncharacterized protein n=1 Tax=Candidatus Trichorickettsia mobilis TaxID=1346319 RepID=A0ABZ0UZH6_9RICK|nr:hypothetical protein [Candidatus Trichorickettsia mobilis]WPY01499.1 hypothetical protein Trichorick_01412 [Candidatus Trichorickettsia mobilis]